jgi:tetratricopeptide (TPR) repeat protein
MMQLGLIELTAGDIEAAVRAYREGFDGLGELGEAGFRSTMGTMLAAALVQVDRLDEAEAVLDSTEPLLTADDADPQVRMRWVRGQVLAGRGRLKDGEGLARQAVALASRTDYLPLHGDSLVALAEVLLAAGKDEQAVVALREAVELFDRKEATAPAAKARARIEELAPV